MWLAVPSVVAVLVTHDGATWLPAVLEGLRGQTTPVDAVVAVDTGSRDDSAELVRSTLTGHVPTVVLEADATTSYPQAVARALARVEQDGQAPDWLWLLHDDSNPEPAALGALLAAAASRPDAEILGPKLREWPSLRRLLELGVTISGTGRRETGLERGEYDQGQHEDVREVFAVNTAGMLVRPAALTAIGGLDENLPMFGNDLDLGWRAAAAGKTTLVVPQAIVFHAEAAHRGVRRTALTGRHTHYQERRAALYTLLANSQGRWLPFQLVRLALGTLLRVLGFLVVRAPGEALDELAALLSVYGRPGQVLEARRRRKEMFADGGDTERVRRLLAPWWLPYRHGLDFVSDVAAALTNQAADVAERRREAAAARDPNPPAARHREDEDEFEDTGLAVRFLTNPIAVALAVAVVALVVGARGAFGDVVGGALSPVPGAAGDWWRLHLEAQHPIGFGSSVPAPPYVLPLALVASLLGPVTTMSVLLVLAAPLALWGAWRFLRVVGRLMTTYGAPPWLLLWGATTYALVPLVAGAFEGGRWGVVVGTAVLPWVAHAALGFADPEAPRRVRAGWRVGLLLTLLTAVAPTAWWLFLVLGAVVLTAGGRVVPGAARDRSVWGPPALALGIPLVLLLPWWLPALLDGAVVGTLLDVGRWPTVPTSGVDLALGRLGDLGAPWWLGLVLPALALLALVPRTTRIGVVVCWLVAAVAMVVAVPLGLVEVDLTGVTGQQLGLGPVLLVLHGAWITAVVIAGVSLRDTVLSRRTTAAVVAAVLVGAVAPVFGLVWFAVWGGDDLSDVPASGIPAHMTDDAELGPERGILVLRGTVADGLTYDVVRGDGPTVGEDEIAALTDEDTDVTDLVTVLATAPSPEAVARLREQGVKYVVQPAPADGDVAARLDATGGLERASADDRSTRAWELTDPPPADAVDGEVTWWRLVLVGGQLVAVLVVVVQCLPTIRGRRT